MDISKSVLIIHSSWLLLSFSAFLPTHIKILSKICNISQIAYMILFANEDGNNIKPKYVFENSKHAIAT